jgi:hypothetical protein
VKTNDAGDYYVSIQNGFGSPAFSDDIILTVVSLPTITTQPTNTYAAIGGSATFSVVATGTGTLIYQWRFNDVNRPGATNASYTINNAQTNDAGIYKVVVSDSVGSVTSAPAAFTIGLTPSFTTNPVSQTIGLGCNVGFSALAAGPPPLIYQWQFMGGNIPGATNSSYSIANVQTTNAGTYLVVVTNTSGTATSTPATLTVDTTGYTISGHVLNGSAGLSGVSIQAVGTNGNRSATTDATGYYTVTGLQPGTYSLTASLSGYLFSGPLSESVPSCVGGADFTVVGRTYTLGGRVTTTSNAGVSGVSIRAVGAQSGTFPATTDSAGAYSISGLSTDSFTVTPTKNGITFNPDSITLLLATDSTNVSFLAGPYFTSIVHLTNGQVRLTLFGPVDGLTHIQGSTNLPASAWINLFTNKTSNQFLDTNAPNFRQRFYRAVR